MLSRLERATSPWLEAIPVRAAAVEAPRAPPPEPTAGRVRFGVRALVVVTTALVLLIAAGAEAAAPSFVQGRAKRVTSGTVNRLAFSSANTAGNLIVVYVSWSNPGTVTVSDTRNNTYSSVAAATSWGAIGAWRSQGFFPPNV